MSSVRRMNGSHRTIVATAFACAVLHGGGATAEQSKSPAPASAEAFLRALQQAVGGDDRKGVSALAAYPLNVLASGLQIPVRSSRELIDRYDVIFTPEVRCRIDQTGAGGQDQPATKYRLDGSVTGVSIGGGAVWATQANGRWKIARVMVTGAPAPKRSPPPRTVTLGGRPAQFAGTLVGDAADSYIMSPGEDSAVDVTIERFRGNDLELRVVDAQSGETVNGAAGPRRWRGVGAAKRKYRIDVIRRADYCAPPTSYLLTVATR